MNVVNALRRSLRRSKRNKNKISNNSNSSSIADSEDLGDLGGGEGGGDEEGSEVSGVVVVVESGRAENPESAIMIEDLIEEKEFLALIEGCSLTTRGAADGGSGRGEAREVPLSTSSLAASANSCLEEGLWLFFS